MLHVADPDLFIPPEEIERWMATAKITGVRLDVFTYPNTGHFFTDSTLPDYNHAAAERTWERVLAFLGRIGK